MNNDEAAVVIEPRGQHTASVIWLHGLGADGHDFEPVVPALGLPENHGIRFVFPHAPMQPVTINAGMVMRAWYDIQEMNLTKREDRSGIDQSQQILEEYIAAEKAAGIPSDKILLAGFSQGGVVILHTGLRHAEPLAGLIALSTYLGVPESLTAEAHSANSKTPIFMGHGLMDPVIPVQHGINSRERLESAGYSVEWHQYPMEHSVSLEEIDEIGQWLKARLL